MTRDRREPPPEDEDSDRVTDTGRPANRALGSDRWFWIGDDPDPERDVVPSMSDGGPREAEEVTPRSESGETDPEQTLTPAEGAERPADPGTRIWHELAEKRRRTGKPAADAQAEAPPEDASTSDVEDASESPSPDESTTDLDGGPTTEDSEADGTADDGDPQSSAVPDRPADSASGASAETVPAERDPEGTRSTDSTGAADPPSSGSETSDSRLWDRVSDTNPHGTTEPTPPSPTDGNEGEPGTLSLPSPGSSGNPLDGLDHADLGSSVLVLDQGEEDAADTACARLLSTGATGSRNVLFVTITESADERLEVCRRTTDWSGGEFAVVEVGDLRSGSAGTDVRARFDGRPVTVKQVGDPSDLSRLGILITQIVSEWADEPGRTIVCINTLTELSQYADIQKLFRFFHVLQGRLKRDDARMHAHLNPRVLAGDELAVLGELFDATVDVSADGTYRLRDPAD